MTRTLPVVLLGPLLLVPGTLSAQDPLRLTLADAVHRALARNSEIIVERENVALATEAGHRAEGAYDVQVRAEGSYRTRTDPVNTIFSGAPEGALAPRTHGATVTAGWSRLFAAGTTAAATTGMTVDTTNGLFYLLSPAYLPALAFEVRHPLLQGRHVDAPRRALRIAAVDRQRSELTLRRTVSDTVAAVERAYWTLVAARRQVGVLAQSVELAEQHRDETQSRIEAGVAPETDLAQAVAEIERRKGELFAARESEHRASVALKLLMLGTPDDPAWEVALDPAQPPAGPAAVLPTRDAIQRALETRPEIGEAMQLLARQDVEIDVARDRLRPALDLVAAYQLRGLAGSENENLQPPFPTPIVLPADLTGSVGRSYLNLLEHRFLDASVGVAVSVPLGNRAARADLASAQIVRRQAAVLLDQVKQRIAAEVRHALVGLETAAQRVEAARAGRAAAEDQLQAERDRFEAGATTSYFVLTRQNELARAEVTEAEAHADREKALSEYARAVGSLLEDRRIRLEPAPGDRP